MQWKDGFWEVVPPSYFLRGASKVLPGSRRPWRISLTASRRVRAAFLISSNECLVFVQGFVTGGIGLVVADIAIE
jgi:hypothetical protein